MRLPSLTRFKVIFLFYIFCSLKRWLTFLVCTEQNTTVKHTGPIQMQLQSGFFYQPNPTTLHNNLTTLGGFVSLLKILCKSCKRTLMTQRLSQTAECARNPLSHGLSRSVTLYFAHFQTAPITSLTSCI